MGGAKSNKTGDKTPMDSRKIFKILINDSLHTSKWLQLQKMGAQFCQIGCYITHHQNSSSCSISPQIDIGKGRRGFIPRHWFSTRSQKRRKVASHLSKAKISLLIIFLLSLSLLRATPRRWFQGRRSHIKEEDERGYKLEEEVIDLELPLKFGRRRREPN